MLTDGPRYVRDKDYVFFGDNWKVLRLLPTEVFQLIYIDPPFNTGKVQRRLTLRTTRATPDAGDRTGFGGHRYGTERVSALEYPDIHDDYLGFLKELLVEARRVLRPDGTLYVHLDYREAHYVKILLDEIFGRNNFLNEIIWAYDYGGRAKDRWPAKHDTILAYTRTPGPGGHYFDQDAVERIPYMAPGLVGPEKAARGKLPTDVWWHTIVPTNGREKTGYPNQKPEGILSRIVTASSAPGESVLDFFAGSGTTGAVARLHGRRFVLVDHSLEALDTIRRRLGWAGTEYLDARGPELSIIVPG